MFMGKPCTCFFDGGIVTRATETVKTCRSGAAPLGTIAVLNGLYVGDFARYRHCLVLADDPRAAISLIDLLRPDSLDEQLLRFRPSGLEEDRRALVSHWSRHYFVRLIPPVTAAAVLLDHRLPLGIQDIGVILDDEGRPEAFKLPDEGDRLPESCGPFGRFAHLVEDNLGPVIEKLCSYSGLSAKVLWSNAGNYFEAMVTQLAAQSRDSSGSDGQALVGARFLPDGRPNPLFEPVRYVELKTADGAARTWRRRRLCCIRYLLEGVDLCPNCPRLGTPP